jgi:hypothetical protein
MPGNPVQLTMSSVISMYEELLAKMKSKITITITNMSGNPNATLK